MQSVGDEKNILPSEGLGWSSNKQIPRCLSPGSRVSDNP